MLSSAPRTQYPMRLSLILLLATAWVGWASDVELRAIWPPCLNPTPFPVSSICDVVKLTTSPEGCPALGLLPIVAGATQPPKCRAASNKLGGIAAPPHVDRDGTVLPQDLPDVRSEAGILPADLNQAAYMKAEGSTYFWYYRQLLSLVNYAPCTKSPTNTVEMPAPKGWDIVGFFNAPPPPELPASDTLPFAMLLKPEPSYSHKRRDSCKRWYAQAAQDLEASAAELVAAQGGQGDQHHTHHRDGYDNSYNKHYNGGDDSYNRHHGDREYGQDRGYGWNHRHYHNEHYSCGKDESEGTSPHMVLLIRGTLTAAEWAADVIYSQITDPTYGPGMISAGFYSQAESLWKAGLGATVEREVARGCKSITIAGHSLGGAVTQLLAVRIEALFATEEYHKAAPVTVVTFGSPAVGDEKWAENFDVKINARKLAFNGDLIAQTPCVPQAIDCTDPTAIPSIFWKYTRTGGNIILPGADMPFDAPVWDYIEDTSGQALCDPTKLIPAYATGHVCSYLCATSRYVNVANNLCWITPNVAPPAGATPCDFTWP